MLLGVFALGLTAVIALALVSGRVGDSLEQKLLAFGANILVSPKTDTLTVSYGGFQLGDLPFGERSLQLEEVDSAIRSIQLRERISAVAPKLVAMTEAVGRDARKVGVGVVGVRWEDEKQLKGFWAVQGAYPDNGQELIAGFRAAESLGLKPGDTLELFGNTFTVSGVLHSTGSDDDKVLFADITTVQAFTGQPGSVSFVEVAALCSGCPIEDIVAEISNAMPGNDVTALKNVVKQRMYSVEFVQRLVLAVSLVILLTACAMVGLAMLSSVNERRKEIGLLRSLGYSKGDIFAIFSFEALFIGLSSGVLGYVCGWFAAGQVVSVLDTGTSSSLPFQAGHLLLAAFAAALVSMLSASFPAAKAARVRPYDALAAL
ncbi:ABC transporter permease [Paucidesulfovibrio longus]|uniref:ABC transporter permease n=1 Tax=Paucidesulfovibrio longus TaxID=889 RepID=UPI000418CD8A|nr:FtsX-like permease family protein [Paucidesulfovibrio longus]